VKVQQLREEKRRGQTRDIGDKECSPDNPAAAMCDALTLSSLKDFAGPFVDPIVEERQERAHRHALPRVLAGTL
jgi:hypothetical protein